MNAGLNRFHHFLLKTLSLVKPVEETALAVLRINMLEARAVGRYSCRFTVNYRATTSSILLVVDACSHGVDTPSTRLTTVTERVLKVWIEK